jgi:hypothetical protein
MSLNEAVTLLVGFLQGFGLSTVFILALFIGFCVVVGFTKLKRTAGTGLVIKSLDEAMSHRPVVYLTPTAPRGPADQLASPELNEKRA